MRYGNDEILFIFLFWFSIFYFEKRIARFHIGALGHGRGPIVWGGVKIVSRRVYKWEVFMLLNDFRS